MLLWHDAGAATRFASSDSWLVVRGLRRILHGASQRLVVVAPHTIASGYERRRAAEYGWCILVGWLLMALLAGVLICAVLQLPRQPKGIIPSSSVHEGTNGTHGRLQGPAAWMVSTSQILLRPVESRPSAGYPGSGLGEATPLF